MGMLKPFPHDLIGVWAITTEAKQAKIAIVLYIIVGARSFHLKNELCLKCPQKSAQFFYTNALALIKLS
jgi:hypothetical protein